MLPNCKITINHRFTLMFVFLKKYAILAIFSRHVLCFFKLSILRYIQLHLKSIKRMTFFDREVDVDGKTLKISQQYVGDVGGVVWDAALVLNGFLENISEKIKGKNILELGAGTGVSGLIAAYFGARVSITDTSEFIPLIEKNIEQNKELIKLSPVYPFCLDWRYFDDNVKLETPSDVTKKLDLPFDIIILSDCIYYERKRFFIILDVIFINL